MATAFGFDQFLVALASKKHNLASDTLKLALSNTAPTQATDDTFSDITEIAAGNGYIAGGLTLDSVTVTVSSGVLTVDFANEVLTASGGSIGPFRYVVIYNDTATNDELIGYFDLGSSQTVLDGQSYNFNVAASGFFTITLT